MISLIHPSRGRPVKSYLNARKWVEQCGADVELILINDLDDPTKEQYRREYDWFVTSDIPFARVIGNHNGVVHATNMGAAKSRGEILVYLSDDFDCFKGWGLHVIDEFLKYSGPTLLKIDDGLQPFQTAIVTCPIMNRDCYNKLGYFFHPGYVSMHCDEHLYWRARKIGALKLAQHLKFQHNHPSIGKAENDAIYTRSAANWEQGKRMLAVHKAEGFIH